MGRLVHFIAATFGLALAASGHSAECVPPGATTAEVRALSGLPGSGVVDAFAFFEGVPYVVVDGDLFGQEPEACDWDFLQTMYDPAFYTDSFFEKDGQWYRVFESGVVMPLSTEFADDFESGSTVADMLPADGSRYTQIVLLSPLAPTVPEYNALAACLRAGTCDFLDNRVDFDNSVSHSGNASIRFYSVGASPEMITSKALLERGLYVFHKGDHAWFSSWYKTTGPLPFTLLDFETSGITHRPGLRITIRNGALGAELKWLDKPQYLQAPDSLVQFPLEQWVHVGVHIVFSEDEFGLIEIWQDGVQILRRSGRTLPTADSVIDHVQIGVTATPHDTVLHMDDVRVSALPISFACDADIDASGTVGLSDLLTLLAQWGSTCDPGCAADIAPQPDGDGLVGMADLLLVLGQWGPC